MMDFNLILLLVGLGLLLLIAVFVLLGALGGFKRELKCTAIAVVLFIVALLVFGDASVVLNLSNASLINQLKSVLPNVSSSAKTVWEVVLSYAQNAVPNGAEIFVDGTESYAFLYDVASGVVRGVELIVGVFAVMLLTLLVNGIFRIVASIVNHHKAKTQETNTNSSDEHSVVSSPETVLVTEGEDGVKDGVVITASKKPTSRKSHDHLWGGVLAGIRAVIIIVILFTPISGICNVLDEISPETEKMLKEVLNGGVNKTASNADVVDTVMDFRDAYKKSAVGKIVDSSKFFFKDSISAKLFNSAFTVTTEKTKFSLGTEAKTFVKAANGLEGNSDYKNLTDEEVSKVLDELKNSKLIPALMPAALEVGYKYPVKGTKVEDYLVKANQQSSYLSLRDLDWDKNIDQLLDALKEAYKINFFDQDFNFLTIDTKVLEATASKLGEVEFVQKALNIGVLTALKLDVVENKVGELDNNLDLSALDWKTELVSLVNVYDKFKGLEITSLKDIDAKGLIKDILNDDKKTDVLSNTISSVFHLQLMNVVAVPVLSSYVVNLDTIKDEAKVYEKQIREIIKTIPNDIDQYLVALKTALPLLNFEKDAKLVDVFHLDPDTLQNAINDLFDTKTFEDILPIATHIALGVPKVKDLLGDYKVTFDPESVNWKQDFTSLVDIYKDFLNLGIDNAEQLKSHLTTTLNDIFSKNAKVETVDSMLAKVADLGLFSKVALPAGNAVLNTYLKKNNFAEFADIIDLNKSVDAWKQDFASLVDVICDVRVITGFSFKLGSIDFSETGMSYAQEIVQKLLSLNLLENDETKNNLVLAAVKKYKLLDDEDIEKLDLSKVKWLKGDELTICEADNLKAILAVIGKLSSHDGFDLNNKKFDYEKLLENDEVIDLVVDILDSVADSNLSLELLPGLLNKYALPKLENIDDEDGTLANILKGFDSKELVEEVQKLSDALKAAVKLNVLKAAKDGVTVIDFANTNAMRTIINGIFDSKIIEGNEGRIIRIILRVTKIFENIEKDALVGIDYDREQQLLLSAIDSFEVVMKDDKFLDFDENGKLVIDKAFYTDKKVLDAAFATLDVLFGKYSVSDSNVISETDGSKLVEKLLPEAYSKYIKGIIPDALKELVEVIKLDEQTGEDLMSDVRHLIYSANVLTTINAQTYITENDYDFSNALEGINKIIDATFDMHCITGNEASLVTWGVNKLATKMNSSVRVSEEDFASVDWKNEVSGIKVVIGDILEITNANDLSTVEKVKKFVKDKQYLDKKYYTDNNAELVFVLFEDVVKLNAIDQVLPTVLNFALEKLEEKGYSLTYLADDMTPELLTEDVNSIIKALRIAVEKCNLLDYYRNSWEGILPDLDSIYEVLDIVVNLNLVSERQYKLINFATNKFIKENKYLNASDIELDSSYSFAYDYEILKDVLREVYVILQANNLNNVEDVKAFIKNKDYTSNDFVSEENISLVADLLDVASNMKIVGIAGRGVINNVINLSAVKKYGNFTALKNVNISDISADLKVVASELRAGKGLLAEYYASRELNPIDFDAAADMVTLLGESQIVEKYGNIVVSELVKYALSSAKIVYDGVITAETFASVNWYHEFKTLGETIREASVVLKDNNLVTIDNITSFIKNKGYLLFGTIVTNDNVLNTIKALEKLTDSKILESLGTVLVSSAANVAKDKGYDISFIKEGVSNESIINDMKSLLAAARVMVEKAGLVDLYQNNWAGELPELDSVFEALDLVVNMSILDGKRGDAINLVLEKLPTNLKKYVNAKDFDLTDYDFDSDYAKLKTLAYSVYDLLDANNLKSITNLKRFVNEKWYNDGTIVTEDNVLMVADLINQLSDINIADQAISSLIINGTSLDAVKKFGDYTCLKEYTSDDVNNDLKTLSNLIKMAVKADLVKLYNQGDIANGDIEQFNYELFNEMSIELGNLHLFTKFGSSIVPEAVNYVANNVAKVNVTVSSSDFENVDWADEFALLGNVLLKTGDLLHALNLESVSKIKAFIKNKDYQLVSLYLTNTNVDLAVNVLDEVLKSKLASGLSLAGASVALSVAAKAGYDVKFLLDDVTAKDVFADVKTVVKVVKTLINDVKVVDLYSNNWNGNIPSESIVIDILDNLFTLNILKGKEGRLLDFAVNKFMPKNSYLVASDFDFLTDFNFDKNFDAIKETIGYVYDLLDENNLLLIQDVKSFFKKQWYKDSSFVTENNVLLISNIISTLSDSSIATQAVAGVVRNAVKLDSVKKFGDYTVLTAFTEENATNDLGVISTIINMAVEAGAIELYNTKNIENINFDLISETVDKLSNLQTLYLYGSHIVPEALNYVFANVVKGFTSKKFTYSDFESTDWQIEAHVLSSVVENVGTLFDRMNFKSVNDVKAFVKDGDYKMVKTYLKTDAADALIDVLDQLLESSLVYNFSNVTLVYGLDKLAKSNANYNFKFLSNSMDNDKVIADAKDLVNVLTVLVDDMHLVDLYQNEEGTIPARESVILVLDTLRNLNIIADKETRLLDKVFDTVLKNNKYITFSDVVFDEEFDFSADYRGFKQLVNNIYDLLETTNLVTVQTIKKFVKEKWYLDGTSLVNSENINIVADALDTLSTINLAKQLMASAIRTSVKLDSVKKYGDYTVLDTLDYHTLTSDLGVLADMARLLPATNTVTEMFVSGSNEKFNFEAIAELVSKLSSLNIVNDYGKYLVPEALNALVRNNNVEDAHYFTATEFESINWKEEFGGEQFSTSSVYLGHIGSAILAFGDLLTAVEADTVTGVKLFISEKKYQSTAVLNSSENVALLTTAVNKLLDSKLVDKLVLAGFAYGTGFASKKGYDVRFLTKGLTEDMLVSDVRDILDALKVLVEANVPGFAIDNEELKQEKVVDLENLVYTVVNLKTLSGENYKERLISVVLNKFGIEANINTINWDAEADTLVNVLDALNKATIELEILGGKDIYNYVKNYKELLKLTPDTNKHLNVVANLLDAASTSQLVAELMNPISRKYLTSDKLSTYADLHNIYSDGKEFTYDLGLLANALHAAVNFDIYSVSKGIKDIPYELSDEFNIVIRSLFATNYLNKEGRIKALASKASGADLSSVEFGNINLKADAEHLVSIYANLKYILTRPEFFYKNVNDKTININIKYWTQASFAEYFDPAFKELLEVSLVKETKGAVILAIALPILKSASPKLYNDLWLDKVNLSEDSKHFGEVYEQLIPILKNTSLSDLNTSEGIKKIIYDNQQAISNVVSHFIDISIAPHLVKYVYDNVKNKVPNAYKSLVSDLQISDVDDDTLRADIKHIAVVLEQVKNIDALNVLLFKKDITLNDQTIEYVTKLIEELYDISFFADNYGALIEDLIRDVLKVDITNIDFASIDWNAEKETDKAFLINIAAAALSYNYTSYKDLYEHFKDLPKMISNDITDGIKMLKDGNYKEGLKLILSTITDELSDLDFDKFADAILALSSSEFVANAGLTIYNKYVPSKLPTKYQKLGDLSSYSQEQFVADLKSLGISIKQLADSKVLMFLVDRTLVDEVTFTENLGNAIKGIANLSILDMKKQELVNLTSVSLDLTSVDLSADSEILSNMSGDIYHILLAIKQSGFEASLLGNVNFVDGLSDAINDVKETTVGIVFLDKVISKINRTKRIVNDNAYAFASNIVELISDAKTIGLLGSSEIDLTNIDAVKSLIDNLSHVVNLKYSVIDKMNKFAENIDAYGVITIDWSSVKLDNEISTLKDLIKDAKALYEDVKPNIDAKDYAFITDVNIQNRLTALVEKGFTSSVVYQLFFPVLEGTYKYYSRDYGEVSLKHNLTHEEITSKVLPDVYELATYIDNVCGFKFSTDDIDLYQFTTFAEIIRVIFNDPLLKDNMNKLIEIVADKALKKPLTMEQCQMLDDVDLAADSDSYIRMMNELASLYSLKPFKFDKESLKDAVVLNGIADALKEIEDTNIIRIMGKELVKVVNDKVVSTVAKTLSDLIDERLNDETYTNELFASDFKSIVSILKDAANSNVLASRKEFGSWDFDALDNIIDNGFGLNMVIGYEERFVDSIYDKLPSPLDEYYLEASGFITDWVSEFKTIMATLKDLASHNITSVDQITKSDDKINDILMKIDGVTIETALKSEILAHAFVKIFNDVLASYGKQVTLKEIRDVENWVNEIDVLQQILVEKPNPAKNYILDDPDMINDVDYIMNHVEYILVEPNALASNPETSYVNKIVKLFKLVNSTTFDKSVAQAAASKKGDVISNTSLVRDYLGADVIDKINNNVDGTHGWYEELNAIADVLECLDKGGSNIKDLRDSNMVFYSLSQCSSDIVTYALNSYIVKSMALKAINDSLRSNYKVPAGMDIITEEDLKDNSIVWNEEFAVMDLLTEALKYIDVNDHTTLDTFYTEFNNAMANTTFIKKVITRTAKYLVPTLPVVGSYYANANITTDEEWTNELTIIVNVLHVLPNNVTSLNNPVNSLNGATITEAVKSNVLKAVIVKTLKAELTGLDTSNVESDMDKVTDWNKEIEALKATIKLQEALTSGDNTAITNAAKDVKAKVAGTVLAANIVNSLVNSNAILRSIWNTL